MTQAMPVNCGVPVERCGTSSDSKGQCPCRDLSLHTCLVLELARPSPKLVLQQERTALWKSTGPGCSSPALDLRGGQRFEDLGKIHT